MGIRRTATGLTLLACFAGSARAAVYPTNACVSSKQKVAGAYCKRVLKAWATWEKGQDATKRDVALAQAGTKLAEAWTKAEAKSAAKGSDCAETTLPAGDVEALVGSAAGAIVADVNAGLDLGRKADAKCGQKLLDAAGSKCDAFLKAESALTKRLAKDPGGAKRTEAQAAASAKFGKAWSKQIVKGCPTSASEAGIEQRVDDLTARLIRDTLVSPHVDDTQYTTVSPTGSTTYQGRSLTPICMNGSPYHYFVKRGSVNKLVVYYQGGGACWEQLTCSVPSCDASVNPSGGDNPNNRGSGFGDLDNPNNPFRDWNAVFVSYCSCDVHFGDAAQDYPLHVEHRGYQNAKVVEKWARDHFVNPEVVFVTGSSAGAYGAWFHAPLLHEVWPASRFHVLADAGNGVITQQFLDDFFPNWNFEANLPTDIPGLLEVLHDGSGIPGYTKLIANLFPGITWSHYTTAYDGGSGGQSGFYNVMLNDNDPIQALFWWNGSCAFNTQMRVQALDTAAAIPSNYRYYIGTGSRHTMWGSNKVYGDTTGGVPTIVSWVNGMLASGDGTADPAWTNVECTNCGLTLPNDPAPNPLEAPFTQVGSDVVIDCTASPSGAFLDPGDR